MPFDRILVVEDEPIISSLIKGILSKRVQHVQIASSVAEAVRLLRDDRYDVVLSDLGLPDGSGQLVLEFAMAISPAPLVIMLSGQGAVDVAVRCMQAGAYDYVSKPFTSGQIDVVLRKAEEYSRLLGLNKFLTGHKADEDSVLIGDSPAMQTLRRLIERVSPTDATVLITGESGTGKEMVAQEFHRRSARRHQAFIKMNCAAISETLIESEFFGHERGAFTGATERREGRFELAHQGTLLLDEVSEIPQNLQAKLLRVLQEREFERVGGSRTIKVNVRILATSNRDLQKYVDAGQFRQDLYYRLNVFPINVPALRDRPQDIPKLADHFLARFVRKHGIRASGFTPSARTALLAHKWPGNVRELQNTIERAVIMTDTGREITAATLGLPTGIEVPVELSTSTPAAEPQTVAEPPSSLPSVSVVNAQGQVLRFDEIEKNAIEVALRQSGGNRAQAAEQLGISVRTLRNKLAEYRGSGDVLPEFEERHPASAIDPSSPS